MEGVAGQLKKPETSSPWATPQETPGGVPYFREPGVRMLARTAVDPDALHEFLHGFDSELRFPEYLSEGTRNVAPGSMLSKIAGQLCYLSFGVGHTPHTDSHKYLDNIKRQRHGSVLEHASYTFLVWGVSRSLTHELVRHRAGMAFSQVSQRYVDGKTLRFVMRPEYQGDSTLENAFFSRIEGATRMYEAIAEHLILKQHGGDKALSGEKARDLRKKVNQAARSVLPNETEAPIIVTGNLRSWRHVLEMRASQHAEPEVRRMAMKVYDQLSQREPDVFGDYGQSPLPDGTRTITTELGKV